MLEQEEAARGDSAAEESQPYQPSAVQLARAERLDQYNWFSLYLPLIIVALLILAMAGWMFWSTVVNPTEGNDRILLVSSLADLIIILSLGPVIVSCLLLPAGAIALMVYDREREYSRIHGLQRLLWRVDGAFETARQKVEETSPKVARPVIQFNSAYAAMVRFLKRLKQIIWG